MVHVPQSPTLLYITNPMCAWCYGFTPVVRRLRALWHWRLHVQVLFGDLHAHATEPLQREDKNYLAGSWHRVQQEVHLLFNYGFFTQQNFIYNTEPACRTLLCARLLRPVLTLEVLMAFHSAFYVDGMDLKETSVLVHLVGLFGIRENLFLALFESEEILEQLEEEFRYVDSIGATTFPSMYVQTGQGLEKILQGYVSLDELERRLLRTLENS